MASTSLVGPLNVVAPLREGGPGVSPERMRGTERDGRKIEDGVCGERLFPLNFVPWAEAESKDGGFGGEWG